MVWCLALQHSVVVSAIDAELVTNAASQNCLHATAPRGTQQRCHNPPTCLQVVVHWNLIATWYLFCHRRVMCVQKSIYLFIVCLTQNDILTCRHVSMNSSIDITPSWFLSITWHQIDRYSTSHHGRSVMHCISLTILSHNDNCLLNYYVLFYTLYRQTLVFCDVRPGVVSKQ